MAADWHELSVAIARMDRASESITAMTDDYGHAKMVIEFNSEQRKCALATNAEPLIHRGDSNPVAETKARSNPVYHAAMAALQKDFELASQTIAKWDALMCVWKTAQSIVSAAKESMKQI
jgi:hypothetical protein